MSAAVRYLGMFRAALLGCFGDTQALEMRAVDFDGKRVQYTSALT